MNHEEKLAQIVASDDNNYSKRKNALDSLKDKQLLNQLAENASDEWIRLESAIMCNNYHVLKELLNHPDEQVQLEAAIELNDQEALSEIVLKSRDSLNRDIALNYITDKPTLEKIVKLSTMEKEKVNTAIRLGNRSLTKKMIAGIEDEELRFRMAQSVNDLNVLYEISSSATDSRLRQLADDWLFGLKPDSDID